MNILSTWAKFNNYMPDSEDRVQQEILWKNTYVTIDKIPFIWQALKQAGIQKTNNLLHQTQPRFHEELGKSWATNTA